MGEALQACAEQIKASVDDIVGQVLWQHRNSSVLTKKKYRDAALDLDWLRLGHTKDGKLAIDVFFEQVSEGSEVMDAKGWQQVMRRVARCKKLSGLVNRADADRLWLSHVQLDERRKAQGGLTKADFKILLLSLCEVMGVHPWLVFYTLEGDAFHGTARYAANKLSLSTPSTSGRSTPSTRSRSNSLAPSSTTSPAPSRPHSSSCASLNSLVNEPQCQADCQLQTVISGQVFHDDGSHVQ